MIEELAKKLKDSGIAGAGGAGFPAYAKLKEGTDIVILNCAECEPLLRVHRQLLARCAAEILHALEQVRICTGAHKAYVAVKKSYTDTVMAVNSIIDAYPNIELKIIPEIYPAGDEVVLTYEVTGKVVAHGQIPMSQGVVIFNVETMYNAANALIGKPVTTKQLTIGGAVRKPVTLELPLGTAVEDAISYAGGVLTDEPVYIMGGPMTGRVVGPYDVITKTTNAILVFPKEHVVIRKKTTNTNISKQRAKSCCSQCRICTDICPRNLLGQDVTPNKFMRSIGAAQPLENALFCVSCGLCEMYSCNQGLSPAALIADMKSELRQNGVKPPTAIPMKPVNEYRNERLVPEHRLVERLDVAKYEADAKFTDIPVQKNEIRTVKLLLSQCIGAPAVPIVTSGDAVKKGDVVAKAPENALGLPMHASINGKVETVTEKYIIIKSEA